MKKKIVITGCNGFLGLHLCQWFLQAGWHVVGIGRGNNLHLLEGLQYVSLDLLHASSLADVIKKLSPQFIIHNAAMSRPNDCEANKKEAILNNAVATTHVVDAAKAVNAAIIFISTDFVFGENGPHEENALPDPLNFYGYTKLMAEKIVATSGIPFSIIRPVLIYGPVLNPAKPSFLHWAYNNIKEGKQIKVVSDQLKNPTFVLDLCAAIEKIINQNKTGTFHIAGEEIISPYEMVIEMANLLGLDHELVTPVTEATFPEPVRRAKKGGLIIDKAKDSFQFRPITFVEGLKITFQSN